MSAYNRRDIRLLRITTQRGESEATRNHRVVVESVLNKLNLQPHRPQFAPIMLLLCSISEPLQLAFIMSRIDDQSLDD